jgi:hypothetical protein
VWQDTLLVVEFSPKAIVQHVVVMFSPELDPIAMLHPPVVTLQSDPLPIATVPEAEVAVFNA